MIKLTEKIIIDAVLFAKLQKLKLAFPGVEFIENEVLRTTNTVIITGCKGYYSADIVFSDELKIMRVPEWETDRYITKEYKLKIEYNLCEKSLN